MGIKYKLYTMIWIVVSSTVTGKLILRLAYVAWYGPVISNICDDQPLQSILNPVPIDYYLLLPKSLLSTDHATYTHTLVELVKYISNWLVFD